METSSIIYKEYAPPPPISVNIELLDEQNASIAGDIELDEQGKLLKKYFTYENVGSFIKEEYNLWITKILPKQVEAGILIMPDESYIKFENVVFRKPQRRDPKTGRPVPMKPHDAHERDLSYLAEIYADRVHYSKDGKTILNKITLRSLAKAPAMVGSVACHLEGMTKTQLLKEYECIADPFGWFIVEGLDKVILLQEKLSANRILIFSDTKKGGGIVAKMTCVTLRGSTIVHLRQAPQGEIRINLHFLGKDKSMNVLSVFRILGVDKLDQMLTMIMQFTPYKKKLLIGLAATITEFSVIGNDYEEVRRLVTRNDLNEDEAIRKLLRNEVFPQISLSSGEGSSVEVGIGNKLQMLGLMIARFTEATLGLRQMDDRDSWSNKRIVGPARSIERLFSKAFHTYLDNIQGLIKEGKISTFTQASNEIDRMKITEEFITAFRGNSWGMKGSPSYSKENITDLLKRESPLAIYSQLLRINTPTNRKAKQPSIRMVQGSQSRFICIVQVPEGQNCNRKSDTFVQLENGIDSVRIDQIGEKQILSVNEKSLKTEPTKIVRPFEYNTKDKNMPLYEIKTVSGKMIAATADHPFLTQRGWINAKDLKADSDSVVVKHMYRCKNIKEEQKIKEREIVLNLHYFQDTLKECRLKEDVILQHAHHLEQLKLLPLYSDSFAMPILARLYGFSFSSDKSRSQLTKSDFEQLDRDLQTLGIQMECLSSLILALTEDTIPSWIMNGSTLVKREFLGAFNFNDYDELRQMMFGEQFKILFDCFGVDSVSSETRAENNFIQYMETIGYRYASEKFQKNLKVYSYLSYKKENNSTQVIDRYLEIEKYLKENPFIQDTEFQYQKIAAIQQVQADVVCDFTTESSNHSFVANGFVTHNCGIVKYNAITSKLSLEREDTILIQRIRDQIHAEKSSINSTPLVINGRIEGWCAGAELKSYLLKLRRSGEIPYDTSVFLEMEGFGLLSIYTNGERPLAPLLIIDENSQELLLDQYLRQGKLSKNYTFFDLLKLGVAEYLDPLEAEYSLTVWDKTKLKSNKDDISKMEQDLADKQLELRAVEESATVERQELINNVELITNRIARAKSIKYTHCDIDPTSILGVAASLIPFLGHNQAPRDVLACGQNNQALSIFNSNQMYRFDKTTKALAFPTRPIVETQMNSILGFDEMPAGTTGVVAFMPYKGYGQEDAFIFKKEAIERGFMWYIKYMTYKITVMNTQDYTEEIKTPAPKTGENPARYDSLNEFGVARIGYPVREGDYLIGKIRRSIKKDEKTGKEEIVEDNMSVSVGLGDEGVVERVLISFNDLGQIIIKIRIRDVRKPEEGDKFTMRSAGQKGTIGRIEPEVDLPRTAEGITPDIIVNVHALPSRMTMGMTYESFVSKAFSLIGKRYNATAFRPRNFDAVETILTDYGYSRTGTDVMYSGTTGLELNARIFMGPSFYQALRHHVKDKIQARGCGKKVLYTRQPNHGRARNGALRFGEQERDANISHGASRFLQERLCDVSDAITIIMCTRCNRTAVPNLLRNEFSCSRCRDEGRFGRIRIPNAFKTVMGILQAAGIQTTLVTKEKPKLQREHTT